MEDDVAEADPLDAAGLEVAEPRRVRRLVGAAVELGPQPAVAQPQLGVLGRVLHLALNHPAVQAGGLQPAPDPLGPRLPGVVLPVGQELGDPAGGEVRADAGDEVAHQQVPAAAGVAVLHERQAGVVGGGRGDDEGRVGHDQVEGLPGDRLEQGAAAQVEPGPGERGVERGEAQGARGDVGGDHVLAVPGGVQGLDPAAGAEVEDALARVPHGELGQGEGRPADAQDVVGGQRRAGLDLAEVGGDPPVRRAGGVRGAVGAQVDPRAHGVVRRARPRP